jgi:hypothetical protein
MGAAPLVRPATAAAQARRVVRVQGFAKRYGRRTALEAVSLV